MRRTLTSALPHATPGEQVRLQGWVHRRRELAKVTFLVVRDRTGLAQVVLPAGTELPSEETPVEVVGRATAERAGARRRRGHRGDRDRAQRAGRHPGGGALATHPRHRPADAARPRRHHLATPDAAREVGARGREPARVPPDPRRAGLHRGPLPQDRRAGDRERRQRVPGRLLRPPGVPRPEPAVLQAAAGRGVRARLRGGAGVPRRAARHGATPRGVRLARRRARLRRGPPRGHGLPARRRRRHGRRRPGVRRPRGRAARHRAARGSRRRSRRSTSATPSRSPAHRPTSPTSARRTSAPSASGRRASTGPTSSWSRATRPRTARSTAIPTRPTRAGAGRST